MSNNVIPVVFTFDKRIILGASVAIKSLIDCAKETTTYDIRIFHSDLDVKMQNDISKLTKGTRHKIAFHYVNPEIFKNAPHNNHSWTEIVYYRFLVPNLLPEYDKAIYSDVDVLFKDDLSELYNTDIEGYELGAIPTCTVKSIKINHPKRYFEENKNEKNYISGILLINNKLMREEKTLDKMFVTIKKFGNRLVYFDMDCLNLTCTKIKDISLQYCVFETLYEYSDIRKAEEYKILTTIYTDEQIKQAINNPKIIHYAGKLGKPWRRKFPPNYYQEYINKLPKTLVKFTLRDIRKKWLSKDKYAKQKFDVVLTNFYYTQNYGACLTAYSLQEIIKNLGYSCAFINEFNLKKKYNLSFGTLFVNRYLKLLPKFNNTKKAGTFANIFITGSDQVLRPQYLKNKKNRDLFLLNFVNKDAKKIAYSASFGIDEKEFCSSKKKIKDEIKNALEKFDYISVREDSGVDICKNQFKINADWIIDPVFLVDNEKFIDLVEKSNKTFKNRIVSYILDKTSEKQDLINQLSEKYHLENIELSKTQLSVEDWVKAFMEADYIVTDSYHGVCFSLIFNKKFLAFVNKKRGASRFDSLDRKFNIKNCLIEQNVHNIEFNDLDYININNIIQKEKTIGIEKLKKQLQTGNKFEN